MGFLSFLFGNKAKKENKLPKTKEGNDLLMLNDFIVDLLAKMNIYQKKSMFLLLPMQKVL